MIDSLLSRASTKNLMEPGPSEAELSQILAAAVRAADHGKLRPWNFVVIRGEGRTRLGELFVEALRRRDPAASAGQLEKEREKALRAPLTIGVVAKIVADHKVPAVEQLLSAGAAAMNILNAAHALGFGAKWITGANCYDPWFLDRFGLEPADQLAGFIQIGSAGERAETARPDPALFTREF